MFIYRAIRENRSTVTYNTSNVIDWQNVFSKQWVVVVTADHVLLFF